MLFEELFFLVSVLFSDKKFTGFLLFLGNICNQFISRFGQDGQYSDRLIGHIIIITFSVNHCFKKLVYLNSRIKISVKYAVKI